MLVELFSICFLSLLLLNYKKAFEVSVFLTPGVQPPFRERASGLPKAFVNLYIIKNYKKFSGVSDPFYKRGLTIKKQKMLQEIEIKEIEHEMQCYPHKKAACIEALKIVQKHRHWVSDDAVKDIAAFLDMTTAEVDSVATFYNLIFRQPVGKHVILICDSISCWVMGYENLLRYLCEKLNIGLGETTSDGMFTLLPIACLGACDKAPAFMIDETLYGDLTIEKIGGILENIREKGK